MYGASSNINPYSALSQGGHNHSHGGHAHGGHGHSHAPGQQCGSMSGNPPGEDKADFPSPGPLDKPKVAVPKPSKPDPQSMNVVQAVQYGEIQKLQEFVDNGTDVRKPDDENVTLLHWAAINNRIEIVK